jgi:hypothetical protein
VTKFLVAVFTICFLKFQKGFYAAVSKDFTIHNKAKVQLQVQET